MYLFKCSYSENFVNSFNLSDKSYSLKIKVPFLRAVLYLFDSSTSLPSSNVWPWIKESVTPETAEVTFPPKCLSKSTISSRSFEILKTPVKTIFLS